MTKITNLFKICRNFAEKDTKLKLQLTLPEGM